MVNLTVFIMIYTFIISSLIIKELEANEISTLKSLCCILKDYVLIPGHANKKNSHLCLHSECKIHCVVYAANWEPNKLPEQEMASYGVYLTVISIACKL